MELAICILLPSQKLANGITRFGLTSSAINQALNDEFSQDELDKWNVEILPNNTIRFKSPDVLFTRGKSELSIEFQFILDDFFPRYIKTLTNNKFISHIDEIRVEGHTSSTWNENTSKRKSYIYNLEV